MKQLILLIACTYSYMYAAAQDSSYRDSIDIVLTKFKKGNKIYHDNDSAGKRHYYYNKASEQIKTIIFLPAKMHSAYYFDYINNQLVRIKLQLPYSMNPSAAGKPMRSVYYFRNNVLVDKTEINFPTIDISTYLQTGINLLERGWGS